MIKQLLNSVIAKYLDLSVSRRSIICLSLRLRQMIDLLVTDIGRYFAQTRPVILNCLKKYVLSCAGFSLKGNLACLLCVCVANHCHCCQICCEGRVWSRPANTKCCGKLGYNPARQVIFFKKNDL